MRKVNGMDGGFWVIEEVEICNFLVKINFKSLNEFFSPPDGNFSDNLSLKNKIKIFFSIFSSPPIVQNPLTSRLIISNSLQIQPTKNFRNLKSHTISHFCLPLSQKKTESHQKLFACHKNKMRNIKTVFSFFRLFLIATRFINTQAKNKLLLPTSSVELVIKTKELMTLWSFLWGFPCRISLVEKKEQKLDLMCRTHAHTLEAPKRQRIEETLIKYIVVACLIFILMTSFG